MSRLPGSIDQRKKGVVLETAAALVAERGPEVSLGQIARASGVSKQTLYNYFGDKPGLFQALLDRWAEPADLPAGGAATDLAPTLLLSAYALSLLTWVSNLQRAASLRAAISAQRPGPTPMVAIGVRDACAAGAVQALVKVLTGEARRGRLWIDDPTAAAELFFDLVTAGRAFGMTHSEPGVDPAADLKTAANACGRVFAQAFAPPQGRLAAAASSTRMRYPAARSSVAGPTHPREEASP